MVKPPRALLLVALLASACSDSPAGSGKPPIARLQLPSTLVVGQLLVFDGSRSEDPEGTLLRFRWSFGDGSGVEETGGSVTRHVYDRPGDFVVCLEVVDVADMRSEACATAQVRRAGDGGVPELGPDLLSPDAGHDAGVDGPPDAQPDVTPDASPDLALDAPQDGPKDLQSDQQDAGDAAVDLAADVGGDVGDLGDALVPDQTVDQAADLPPDLSSDLPPPDLGPPDVGADLDPLACLSTVAGGSGAAGYQLSTPTPCPIDISGMGSKLGLINDDQGLLSFLPFSFSFFGGNQIAVGVSSNGFLQFPAATLDLLVATPTMLPNAASPNAVIAALWDDLAPRGSTSDVYVATLRQAPQRVFVVQWDEWTFKGEGANYRLRFSVRLYEGSNVVELSYLTLDGGARAQGSGAAVGLENGDGTVGLQHAFKQAVLTAGTTLRFVPQP